MEAHLTPEQLERLLDHADWLRALARRLVNDSASADDLVQETWVAALKSPPDVAQPVRPWLAGVLRNLVAMQRRTEGRRAQRNAAAARSERVPSTAELIAEVDLKQNLGRLVVGLPEPMRTTVLLRYHEGLSSAEIARIQGVPAGTVRWRLKRGVDQLRVEMDERYGARESWLASLAIFARVEPVEGVATGGAFGVVSLALGVLVAASLLAVALNPSACSDRRGERAAPLAGSTRGSPATLTPTDVATAIEPVDDLGGRAPAAGTGALVPSTVRLVDARGAPVAGARVIVPRGRGLDGGLLDGLTDAEGELELLTDEPSFEVFVARPGAFVHRVDVTPVEGVALVTLADGALLGGRVVARGASDSTATEPAAQHVEPGFGALVLELDSDRHLWGGREFPPEVVARLGNGRRTCATTDASGRFEFHGLAPDWSGVLWLPGSHRVVGTRSGAYSDESLYLTRPENDLVIELEPRGIVMGRVVDEDHVGLVGAELTAWTPLAANPLRATSGANGAFRFELAPGAGRELVLDVRADPLGTTMTHRFGDLPPDGRLGHLIVPRSARSAAVGAASPGRELHIRVADVDGRPMNDAYVRLRARGVLFVDEASVATGRGPSLRPAREARRRPLHSGPSYALYVMDPDGCLDLTDIAADRPLEVSLEDASGALLERRDLPGDTTSVEFRVVAALRPLAVTVRDEAGELLVGAVVQLGARGERGVFRRTGLDGRTVFAGLSAATTQVDVEVVKRGFVTSLQRGVALEDTPGEPGTARLELVLERGIDTTFVVLDEAGQAVTDATVRVTVGTELVRAANHTGEGRYQLDDLPRAALELHVVRGEQEHRATVEPTSASAALIVHLSPPSETGGSRRSGN